MRKTILLAMAFGADAVAQRLETQPPDPSKVVRVETAKDHLTVIELAGPVTMVAVGNRNAFTVERRDNKVFVTPTDEAARTNLFIWTSNGRFAYELLPAKDVDQMHFAIDQAVAPAVAAEAVIDEAPQKTVPLPAEMLTHAEPVMVSGERETDGRALVTIRDLYQKDGRVYLRYAVSNRSGVGYHPARPAAWRLDGATAQQSLLGLAGQQLGERLARTVRAAREVPVEVAEADQADVVAAGSQGLGWMVIDEPSSDSKGTSVLKMQFAADARGPVTAYLVLPSISNQETARVRPTVE